MLCNLVIFKPKNCVTTALRRQTMLEIVEESEVPDSLQDDYHELEDTLRRIAELEEVALAFKDIPTESLLDCLASHTGLEVSNDYRKDLREYMEDSRSKHEAKIKLLEYHFFLSKCFMFG